MTWKAVRQVIDLEGVKPTAKLVLLALAVRCNPEGRAWPSVKRICVDTGLSERAVQYALRSLVADGHIAVEERDGKPAMLTIRGAVDKSEGGAGDAPQGVQEMREGVQEMHQGVHDVHPEVVKEREKKENRAARSSTGRAYGYVNGHVKDGPAAGESWGEYRERGGR